MRADEPLNPSKNDRNNDHDGLVTSSQSGVHVHLEKNLRRHLASDWSQPLHQSSVRVFRQLADSGVLTNRSPLILDSGCGTGISSLRLARMYPDHQVIGVDQSRARLSKSGVDGGFLKIDNCVLLRAELSAFWRLLFDFGVGIDHHFLLYPNPWPKPGHLMRRWHGHPVFPTLLALGGEIELRCNWHIYAQEFAQAVNYVLNTRVKVSDIKPESGISPFEQKYLERQQSLYAVKVTATDSRAYRADRRQAPVLP